MIRIHLPLRFRRLLWMSILVFVPACQRSDGQSRVEVRGSVTYQGTPVEHGMITFQPAHGSKGPAAGTGIVGGKFFLPAAKGPTAGPHEVEVKIVEVTEDSSKPDVSRLMTHGIEQVMSFSQHVEVGRGATEFKFSFPPGP